MLYEGWKKKVEQYTGNDSTSNNFGDAVDQRVRNIGDSNSNQNLGGHFPNMLLNYSTSLLLIGIVQSSH